MNLKQEAKFKMYLAFRLVCNANSGITATLPNFGEFYENLNSAIAVIEASSELQQHFSSGIADGKRQTRENLEEMVLDNARKLLAYASYVKNPILQSESKLKDADIHSASDITLLNNAKGLYSNIEANLLELAPYMLTAASQATFNATIQSFEAAIPQIRQKQVGKKETNQTVAQAFEAADAAIENIDTVVEIVRLTQPTFYASYKSARKVVTTSGTSLALKGTVTDAETNMPLVDATLAFCIQGASEPVLVKTTAAKGGFQVKSLAEGVYNVSVTKIGYATQTVTITVSNTELYTLDVKLAKG